MIPQDSARSALRAATAEWHAGVDRIFSGFDLTDRDAYGRFLAAQAEAHISVENALSKAGAAVVLPDWPERQRTSLLLADLATLGLSVPSSIEVADFDCPASVLGGVYVLEGSRLGAQLLRRSIPPDFPSSFLSASDPAGWRRLLLLLDEQLGDDQDRQMATNAAIRVFALFERSGRRHLGKE